MKLQEMLKLKWDNHHKESPPKFKNQHSLSQYLKVKVQTQQSATYMNPHKKSVIREQVQQNKYLLRKLSEISRRENKYLMADQLQSELYVKHMADRRMKKKKYLNTIQLQNDNLVERIVRKRGSHLSNHGNSPQLSSSGSREHKRLNRSVLLPKLAVQSSPRE